MQATHVDPSPEVAALRLVGDGGVVVGPVVFGGVRFWGSVEINSVEVGRRTREGVGVLADPTARRQHLENGGAAAVRLHGCLVHETDAAQSLRYASLLAAYTARSILIDDTDDVLSVMVNAALLEQGVIVQRADDQLDVVATPGPRVYGHGLDGRELALLECVYSAWLSTPTATANIETGVDGVIASR